MTTADHRYSSSSTLLKTLDLPPRKLLLNLNLTHSLDNNMDPHFYKHHFSHHDDDDDDDDANNDYNKDSDSDDDPYSSDQFRMYEFKVRRCTRNRSHDWTVCPFAHPGEKARRRDPRKFHYTGSVCPDFRLDGACARGDNCEFSHGVFECWLHPSRYRTEACKDGKACKRKVCFFAHSPRQLRLLPDKPRKLAAGHGNHCHHHHHPEQDQFSGCLVCRGGGGGCGSSVSSSPTSTLLGLSHLSPPMSPSFSSSSPPVSPAGHRFSGRPSKLQSRFMSYKDVLTELVSSLKAMNFSEDAAVAAAAAATLSVSSPVYGGSGGGDGGRRMNLSVNPWMEEVNCFSDEEYRRLDQQQQQFVMSPAAASSPSYAADSAANLGFGKYSSMMGGCSPKINGGDDGLVNSNNGNGTAAGSGGDPDLGWVNELLM